MSATRAPKASAPPPSRRAMLDHKGSVGRTTDGILHIVDHAAGNCRRARPGTSTSRAMPSSGPGTITPRPARRPVRVNIYPQEIEDVLLQDSRVADAADLGVPNEVAEALKARCRELLGPLKVPRSIDFEVNFPCTRPASSTRSCFAIAAWPEEGPSRAGPLRAVSRRMFKARPRQPPGNRRAAARSTAPPHP
jgi:hypothetical protein